MRPGKFVFAVVILLSGDSVRDVSAQANPELEACRSTGLIALREKNPAIKDVTFDIDGMTVAKANTKVEDTPIKTIVFGDACVEKGKQDTRRTFLCLIGEKGKVLLTFFTDRVRLHGQPRRADSRASVCRDKSRPGACTAFDCLAPARRRRAVQGGERVPFRPSHTALFITDPDKANGASSWPVFEPTNTAGNPCASLIFAVFAIFVSCADS